MFAGVGVWKSSKSVALGRKTERSEPGVREKKESGAAVYITTSRKLCVPDAT